MSAPEHIRIQRSGAAVTITVDRPAKRNALALQTVEELRAAVEEAGADTSVRALVLTGAGDRAFASGADISEIPQAMDTPENAWAYDRTVGGLYETLMQAPVPVVARMQASAVGGGLLLALACDIRICVASAQIAIPASRIGLMLSPVEHRLLVRQVPPSRAKLLMFSGRRLDARTALEWGLVDMVAEGDELDARVDALIAAIADGAPLANKAAKRLIDSSTDADLAQECYREIYSSADLKEGISALADKRKPEFQGR